MQHQKTSDTNSHPLPFPKLRMRPATREDAEYLAPRLREADKRELAAAVSPLSPLQVLLSGLEVSQPAAVVLEDSETGHPILMGGVSPIATLLPDTADLDPSEHGGAEFISKTGIVWMMGTPIIDRHPVDLHRKAKAFLAHLFKEGNYVALCNVVMAENTKAVSWLKRLGFSFVHMNQPIGRDGALFHSFAMRRPDHV